MVVAGKLAILLSLVVFLLPTSAIAADLAVRPLRLTRGDGTSAYLSVEIADTAAARSRGLMGRTELAPDTGMLFVFDHADRWVFWMRDTPIPLSIAFIATDGTIVDVQDMKPFDETLHIAAAPAIWALEVDQGYFRLTGFGVGDRADLAWPFSRRLPLIERGRVG